MIPSFTIDLSKDDDIFFKNIRIDPHVTENTGEKNDSYELIAENTDEMFGMITINESKEGFLYSGDDYLSNAELKIVYRKIIAGYDPTYKHTDDPPFTVESFNKVMMHPYTIITNTQLQELHKAAKKK